MNRFAATLIFPLLLLLAAGALATDERPSKGDVGGYKQLLDIAGIYLKAASIGDYRAMQKFASPELKPDRMVLGRGARFYDSKGNEITAYWYIASIIRRPSKNIYDIVLECYAPADDGTVQSTHVHAVAEGRHDGFVLTEW